MLHGKRENCLAISVIGRIIFSLKNILFLSFSNPTKGFRPGLHKRWYMICEDQNCEDAIVRWYRRILQEVAEADWCQFDIATSLKSTVDIRIIDSPDEDDSDVSSDEEEENEEKKKKAEESVWVEKSPKVMTEPIHSNE